MSDRTAQLAVMAGMYRQFEVMNSHIAQSGKAASRDMLRRDAHKLGFPSAEVEAAVDAAIATAQEPAPA